MHKQFWQDAKSGDVFAVLVNEDGNAVAASPSLYYADVTNDTLDTISLNTDEFEDYEFFNGEDANFFLKNV